MMILSGRATLRVRSSGTGPTTVVLVHGWMTTSAVFDAVMPLLDASRCRIVRIDLRGAGGSTSLDGAFGLTDFADDVVGVLDALGVADAVIVGHSMGGQLALLLAASHPTRVRAVCAITPVPLSGAQLPAPVIALFASVATSAVAAQTVLEHATHQLTPASLGHLCATAADVTEPCKAGAFAAWTKGVDVDVGVICAPVLVIASDDPFLPVATLQAVVDAIAGATLAFLPGAGHYPLVEQPAATADLVNAFVRTVVAEHG